MQALVLQNTNPLTLVEREMPDPNPEPGEVIVRVSAAAATPTELLWYPTSHTRDGRQRQAVLAHEFAGTVAACGAEVRDFAVDDHIYGMNDWFDEGALAEYCITRPKWIANIPRGMSHEHAATVPISALTAWQGLFEHARLTPGQRVLVHGGAGAVGLFAVQLAKLHGANVVATASAANMEFVRPLARTKSSTIVVTHLNNTCATSTSCSTRSVARRSTAHGAY